MWQVHESAVIPCEIDSLTEVYASRPDRWLGPFLRIAAGEAASTTERAGRPRSAAPPSRSVRIRTGEMSGSLDASTSAVAVRWETIGFPGVPETFEGTFVFAALDDQQTEVAIHGTFSQRDSSESPLPELAARRTARLVCDRLLLHLRTALVARASVPDL